MSIPSVTSPTAAPPAPSGPTAKRFGAFAQSGQSVVGAGRSTCARLTLLAGVAAFVWIGGAGPFAADSIVVAQNAPPQESPTQEIEPEVAALIDRAEELARSGEYDLAAALWQKTIDESGGLLLREGRRLVPLRERLFRTIKAAPPEALAAYRASADGAARARLADSGDDPESREAATEEVCRRWLLSSVGDDAAFEACGLALDRREFEQAARLARMILDLHPDPSVSVEQTLLRQATADAYLGDRAAVEACLAKLDALAPNVARDPRTAGWLGYLTEQVLPRGGATAGATVDRRADSNVLPGRLRPGPADALVQGPLVEQTGRAWPPSVPLGAERRESIERGAQPPSPLAALKSLDEYRATRAAADDPSPSAPAPAPAPFGPWGGLLSASGTSLPAEARELAAKRSEVVERWRCNRLRPTRQLVVANGGCFFRSVSGVSAWDLDGVALTRRWEAAVEAPGRGRSSVAAVRASSGSAPTRDGPAYDDSIGLSLTVGSNLVWVFERGRQTDAMELPGESAEGGSRSDGTPSDDERLRTPEFDAMGAGPYLAAYDARTGRRIWRRAADAATPTDRDSTGSRTSAGDAGFAGSPLVIGDRLFVATYVLDRYSVLALSADEGTPLWRTTLDRLPEREFGGEVAAGLAAEGGDLYVAFGAGAVYALDARTGEVHWGAVYARKGGDGATVESGDGDAGSGTRSSGSRAVRIVAAGSTAAVLAPDGDDLMAFDRRTGSERWRSPRRLPSGTIVDRLTAQAEGRLYVGGVEVVRAYELNTGRLTWERTTPPATGDGQLTTSGLHVPVEFLEGAAILTLDRATGVELGTAFASTEASEPAGGITTDGVRWWMSGGDRFLAWTDVASRLEAADRSIAGGDWAARLDRARLAARLGRFDEAAVELRTAVREAPSSMRRTIVERAADALVEGRLALERPRETLALLGSSEFREGLGLSTERTRAWRSRLVRTAAVAVARRPQEGDALRLLEAAPQLAEFPASDKGGDRAAIDALAAAVDRAAGASDLAAIRAAAEEGVDPRRRAAAFRALGRLGDANDHAALERYSTTGPSDLRIAAAQSLVFGVGRRSATAAFVDGLVDEDPAVRRRALRALRAVAGPAGPTTEIDATGAAREAASRAWRDWAAALPERLAPGPGVESGPAEAVGDGAVDRLLVAAVEPGRLIEFDLSGKERWRKEGLSDPVACELSPWGGRLALVRGGREIVEFDEGGDESWRSGRLPWEATALEALPDGGLLLACPAHDLVVEVAPDGNLIRRTTVRGGPCFLQRSGPDRLLVGLLREGRVVEIDGRGEVVWEGPDSPRVESARRLRDGRTLLYQAASNPPSGAGVLTVVDSTGRRTLWQLGGIKGVRWASSLPDGRTIVAAEGRVELLDAGGRAIWSAPTPGVRGSAGG